MHGHRQGNCFMAIYEHIQKFAGKPVEDWALGTAINPDVIYRVSIDYDEAEDGLSWLDKFSDFLSAPNVGQTTGLVIGQWDMSWGQDNNSDRVVEALVTAHDQLPNLTALFFGDIVMEES